MDTHALAESIGKVIGPLGLDCLGVEWLPAGDDSCLRVYIEHADAERDVDVDDCEAASREMSAWLDVEDPITSHYRLEVSSPGLDRPLFTLDQVAAVVGETIKVKLSLAHDGSRNFTGKVVGVEGASVRMDCPGQDEVVLDFGNVAQARVKPDWDALGLAPASGKGQRGHQGKNNKRAHRRAGRS